MLARPALHNIPRVLKFHHTEQLADDASLEKSGTRLVGTAKRHGKKLFDGATSTRLPAQALMNDQRGNPVRRSGGTRDLMSARLGFLSEVDPGQWF